ncbi:MAG: ABC transporter permease [Gemmatimonadales bacterium]
MPGYPHAPRRPRLGGRFIEHFARDLRLAIRTLSRTPAHSLTVVACLALGIGPNAAVFSWMDGILLHPYPGVAGQTRLVAVANTVKGSPDLDEVSWNDFNDLETGTTAFSDLIVSKITGATITGGERAERVVGLLVSANYFQALGVRLLLGRGFEPSVDVGNGGHPQTVISYRLWQDRFGGDRSVIGKAIPFNGVPHTIIGVTAKEFLGTFVGYAMQFWVPASQQAVFDPSGYKLDDRGARWIEGFARLNPGVTFARAQAEASAVAARLATDYPTLDRGRGIRLLPLWDSPFDNAKDLQPMLRVMAIVVAFVLLIVCANVTNLLLVRALSRRHEVTVRMAIGASRGLLMQQLLAEGAVLAALGTICGLGLAYAARNVLGSFFAPRGGVSLVIAGGFDWRVIALSFAAGAGCALLFAVAPAIDASSVDLAAALKSDSRLSIGGKGHGRIRSGLVLLQVCLSYVLLVGAGLLLSSLNRQRSESPGFATDGVVTTTVNLFAGGYDTSRVRRFEADLVTGLRTVAGVRSAALGQSTPFATRPYANGSIGVDAYVPARDERPTADYNAVTPGYFATLGIALESGRDFSPVDADTTRPVAIVSAAFAARYWPGKNPLGRRVRLQDKWMDVVAVAKDIRYRSLLKPSTPLVYVPLSQHSSTAVALFVRTPKGVGGVAPAIVRQIHAIDPTVSPYEILTMSEQVARSTAAQQLAAALVALFASIALFLAAIGLYGVIAYVVSQRRRELSLRLAIGASPAHLMRLVLGDGVRLAFAGSLAGAATSLLTTRLLGDLLFRVNPRAPMPIIIAFGVMIAVSLVATFRPARLAGRSDPAAALRS